MRFKDLVPGTTYRCSNIGEHLVLRFLRMMKTEELENEGFTSQAEGGFFRDLKTGRVFPLCHSTEEKHPYTWFFDPS